MPLFITNEIKEIIKKEVLEEIREENNKQITIGNAGNY